MHTSGHTKQVSSLACEEGFTSLRHFVVASAVASMQLGPKILSCRSDTFQRKGGAIIGDARMKWSVVASEHSRALGTLSLRDCFGIAVLAKRSTSLWRTDVALSA